MHATHRQRVEKGLHSGRLDHGQSVGLVEVRGDLGDQAIGSDTDADRQLPLLEYPAADLARDRCCTAPGLVVVRDVEIGFVERRGLDDGGELAKDLEDRLRLFAVAGKLRLDEDRVRAAPERLGRRHCRAHAKAPHLVIGGGHHAPAVGVAADDHRLAAQRRIVAHVDGGIETIHVTVQDAAHSQALSYRLITVFAWCGPASIRSGASLNEGDRIFRRDSV